jgi:hypothetical protein
MSSTILIIIKIPFVHLKTCSIVLKFLLSNICSANIISSYGLSLKILIFYISSLVPLIILLIVYIDLTIIIILIIYVILHSTSFPTTIYYYTNNYQYNSSNNTSYDNISFFCLLIASIEATIKLCRITVISAT